MISTSKKFIAVGGVAVGIACFGMSVSVGTAAADGTLPDTGSYDEILKVDKPANQQTLTGSYGPYGADMGTYDALLNILDPDGFQAASP